MKWIDTHKSGQAGFALIELIVCILIFSIGILAVARLGVEATRGDTIGSHVVSWNVADMTDPATGDPLNFKRIRVIVESTSPGGAKKTTYDYIKGRLTENT